MQADLLSQPPLTSITDIDHARRYVFRWADTYTSLPMILSLRGVLSDNEIFTLLGERWSNFDNVTVNLPVLGPFLMRASREQLDLMMSKEEKLALDELPKSIEIFRYCYEINRHGICWSTAQSVAEEFHTYGRYTIKGEQPFVLRATVSKEFVFMKLDRDESEIVVPDVKDLCILDRYLINIQS